MRDLVIGDCHFGIKNNSIQWMETQLKFFEDQVIPIIENEHPDRVIFLGDIFDIRYSINQMIGYEVKCMIRELSQRFSDIMFYLIAGNHDYYSPDINYSTYNAYNMIFGYEFTAIHTNVRIINDEYLIEDNTVFAPWYWTEDICKYKEMINNIKSNNEINLMYCHSDLAQWPFDERLELKPDYMTIISGHIHNVQQDNKNKLYNIGSIFSINFSDVNTKKYLYVYSDGKFEKAIENITTPKFIQFSNEDIFTLTNEDVENAHVRIFINADNINKAKYIERLSEIKKSFNYLSIKIHTLNNDILNDIEGIDINSSINDFIEVNIPENLKTKYEYIKSIINNENS